jgi:GH18 family chitinase
MDGVDYNWEYPRNDREWRAWAELLRDSKAQLLDGRATVTFTIYLDPAHFDKIQRYDLLRHADFVLCMAYDARDRHSTVEFYQSGFDLAERFKLPRSKFINGLPFYGRDRRTGDPKTYAEIAPAAVKALGKARVLELEPYRPDRDEVALGQGVQYYNSRATIYHKTRMALEQGYGGVMIWEIGQDAQPLDRRGSLMRALQSAIPAERRLPALATPANPTLNADL